MKRAALACVLTAVVVALGASSSAMAGAQPSPIYGANGLCAETMSVTKTGTVIEQKKTTGTSYVISFRRLNAGETYTARKLQNYWGNPPGCQSVRLGNATATAGGTVSIRTNPKDNIDLSPDDRVALYNESGEAVGVVDFSP